VRENVAFGFSTDEIDDDAVTAALKKAALDDVFRARKGYLSAKIGDAGKRLSGGQRQRLAIARALYRNPDIIILDEATSSLDVETEHEITNVINRLKGEKTVIAIAHRLSTLKSCDSVIYMDQGRIIDTGTFAELQARQPQFSNLLKLSSLEIVPDKKSQT
jgi:ATP-binding cassette subfamily C protein